MRLLSFAGIFFFLLIFFLNLSHLITMEDYVHSEEFPFDWRRTFGSSITTHNTDLSWSILSSKSEYQWTIYTQNRRSSSLNQTAPTPIQFVTESLVCNVPTHYPYRRRRRSNTTAALLTSTTQSLPIQFSFARCVSACCVNAFSFSKPLAHCRTHPIRCTNVMCTTEMLDGFNSRKYG